MRTFAPAIERESVGRETIKIIGALVQLVRIHACHAWGHGFESRTHRLRKKTEIRKSKTISSKSVTLGIFFCYTTTDEYPVGSRKLDKSSNQIVTKKKNGNFGYDFVDMSLICRCLRSILSTRRNLKSWAEKGNNRHVYDSFHEDTRQWPSNVCFIAAKCPPVDCVKWLSNSIFATKNLKAHETEHIQRTLLRKEKGTRKGQAISYHGSHHHWQRTGTVQLTVNGG